MSVNIVSVNPESNETGVLLREPVVVLFDSEVDEDAITGGSFLVQTEATKLIRTGPASKHYHENLTADDLESDGFRGIVSGSFSFANIENGSLSEYSGEGDTEGSGFLYRSQATFSPTNPLEANTEYKVVLGRDVTNRTVFDVVENLASSNSTGEISVEGPYTGTENTTVNISITTAGPRGTASFKWWYTGSSQSSEVETNRYGNTLEDGLSIQFANGYYSLGDMWSFVVVEPEEMDEIYSWEFTTSSSDASAPESASNELIGSQIVGSTSTEGVEISDFSIVETNPEHTSANLPLDTLTVLFNFSDSIDSTTITEESVYAEGVHVFGDSEEEAHGDIPVVCSVVDNVLRVTLVPDDSGGELLPNQEIRIYLTNEILDTEGNSLDNYEYYFTTLFDPIYCDISLVYAQYGGIIGDYWSEDVIYRLLYKYSVESDVINFTDKDPSSDAYWRMQRCKWIICSVVRDLILNMMGSGDGSGRKKRLGDLSIQDGTGNDLEDALQRVEDCVVAAEPLVKGLGPGTGIVVGVKGSRSHDRINVGRLPGGYASKKYPATNQAWTWNIPAGRYITSQESRKLIGNKYPRGSNSSHE